MARDEFVVICNVGSGEATELTQLLGEHGWEHGEEGEQLYLGGSPGVV